MSTSSESEARIRGEGDLPVEASQPQAPAVLWRSVVLNPAGEAVARVAYCEATAPVAEILGRHHTLGASAQALAETLVTAGLLSTLVKGEEQVSIRLAGRGGLTSVTVDATAQGGLRGYARPKHLPGLGVIEALGAGAAHVMRALGSKVIYQGAVPFEAGGIGETFQRYLATSEQIPSRLSVQVLVEPEVAARGAVIQAIGGAEPEEVEQLLSSLSDEQWSAALAAVPASPLQALLPSGYQVSEVHGQPLMSYCTCSRDRVEATLRLLGAEDLIQLRDEQGGAEVDCHWCGKQYLFEAAELTNLAVELQPDLLH